jgi:uncharacterized cupin superfamily protein
MNFKKSPGGTTMWGRKNELSHLVEGYFAIAKRNGLKIE